MTSQRIKEHLSLIAKMKILDIHEVPEQRNQHTKEANTSDSKKDDPWCLVL